MQTHPLVLFLLLEQMAPKQPKQKRKISPSDPGVKKIRVEPASESEKETPSKKDEKDPLPAASSTNSSSSNSSSSSAPPKSPPKPQVSSTEQSKSKSETIQNKFDWDPEQARRHALAKIKIAAKTAAEDKLKAEQQRKEQRKERRAAKAHRAKVKKVESEEDEGEEEDEDEEEESREDKGERMQILVKKNRTQFQKTLTEVMTPKVVLQLADAIAKYIKDCDPAWAHWETTREQSVLEHFESLIRKSLQVSAQEF